MAEPVAPQPIQRQIERALLGGDRRYNRIQVTEAAGVSLDRARRLWMAMGFAEVDDQEAVFTEGDVDALRVWDALVGTGLVEQADEASVARALSQPLSRLADWQAQEVLARTRDLNTAPDQLADVAEGLLPVIEGLQSYVWRRHLAAATGRALSATGDELSTQTSVVGFADIVGYTMTTRHSDLDELSALLEAFEKDATETIASHHGRVVKTVGDEVLFVADTPSDAAEIALRLADPGRAERGLPTLRVGMASGQVLSRFGDVYGSVVNLAARLTALARPGTVLVDKELADALRDDDRYQLRVRRPTAVRGYHHLRSWSLRRAR
ncbi:MAG TPA: adenylate/guanylate cyclase domain-containing protein [Pseudonocardiaceae bacterium]|nr:adenylate/guanylate cyclase domain-containing protein [Pseudonocardiaceae bacterium]